MKEIHITTVNNRWLPHKMGKEPKLNPNRIESYWVRGKTFKDCLEILQEHARQFCGWMSIGHLRKYAHRQWGTYIKRPEFTGRGVWITRDHNSKELIEIWKENV